MFHHFALSESTPNRLSDHDPPQRCYTEAFCLFTADRVSGKGNAIGRVRPAVCLLNQLNFDREFLSVWVRTFAHRGSKVKVIGQGQCKLCVCFTSIYCAIQGVLTDVVGFQRQQA